VTNTSISPPTRDTARDDTSHRVSIAGWTHPDAWGVLPSISARDNSHWQF
jgi:hypothetical protein